MTFFTVWSVLCAVLLFLLLWRAHLVFWSKRLALPVSYALEEPIRMPDGGSIVLRRIQGGLPSESGKPPVLLVHGIAVNHRNNDLCRERSFARFLAEHGRDVWLVTMRSGLRARPLGLRARREFKAMRDFDLPHAVAEVLSRTGARELDIACYSMGGMVLYAALGRSLEPRLVRRVVTFASPGQVRPLGALSLARFIPRALTPAVPMRLVTRTFAFAHGLLPRRTISVFYNPRNVPRHFARCSMMELFEDIPGPLGADFVRWAADQGRVTVDGEPLLAGLTKLDVPVCFFAGTNDWLAPAALVRLAHDAWGKDLPQIEKEFVLLGRGQGAREDYGHGDFAFGTHAADEVFAPAFRFLERLSSVQPQLVASARHVAKGPQLPTSEHAPAP